MIIEYEDIHSASRKELAAAYPELSLSHRILRAQNAKLLKLMEDCDARIRASSESLAEQKAEAFQKGKAEAANTFFHRSWKN